MPRHTSSTKQNWFTIWNLKDFCQAKYLATGHMSSKEQVDPQIKTPLRYFLAISGGLLVVAAFVVLYRPPTIVVRDIASSGQVLNAKLEITNVVNPFIAIFVSGCALVLFGVNGLRITRLHGARFGTETPELKEAEKYLKTPELQDQATEVVGKDDESPPPQDSPSGQVADTSNDQYYVYSLAEVPAKVLGDAISECPPGDRPENMGTFEFATRKRGKGNHPWILKFNGKKAIIVTYGGYGKVKPTVDSKEMDETIGQ